jgi:hypothetical protein
MGDAERVSAATLIRLAVFLPVPTCSSNIYGISGFYLGSLSRSMTTTLDSSRYPGH